MTGDTILIAAYSGRALAASARRAGYVPLVVDNFADTDTQAIAAANRKVALSDLQAAPLGEAFDALTKLHGPPIGLVLGAGFESSPEVIAHLANQNNVLGCTAETVALCSDPVKFFGLLKQLGIAHPETRFDPPSEGQGWLAKIAGASGGAHITRCRAKARQAPGRYFQREVSGDAVSAMGISSPKGSAFAFSRQWANPFGRHPYRYGGAVGNIEVEPDLEARLVDTMLTLCEVMKLSGIVSFDFIVTPDGPLLVDVNPRPGATLDILDDEDGTLFHAHVAAANGDDPVTILTSQWKPKTRAAAYLYADRGRLIVPRIEWPEWTADRPAAGFKVKAHAPIATVITEAQTPAAAERLCTERLAALENMLYQSQNLEDART